MGRVISGEILEKVRVPQFTLNVTTEGPNREDDLERGLKVYGVGLKCRVDLRIVCRV